MPPYDQAPYDQASYDRTLVGLLCRTHIRLLELYPNATRGILILPERTGTEPAGCGNANGV